MAEIGKQNLQKFFWLEMVQIVLGTLNLFRAKNT